MRNALWFGLSSSILMLVLFHQRASPFPMIPRNHNARYRKGALFQSSTSDTPPIAKEVFLDAVRILDNEISRQTGIPVPTTTSTDYIIGKLQVTLSIIGNPGLDLTESGGLVLVTTVEGNAIEANIRTKDTIVQVSVPGTSYSQDCAGWTLEDLSKAMETAVGYAIQEETGSIDLILNRLLPIEYMD